MTYANEQLAQQRGIRAEPTKGGGPDKSKGAGGTVSNRGGGPDKSKGAGGKSTKSPARTGSKKPANSKTTR